MRTPIQIINDTIEETLRRDLKEHYAKIYGLGSDDPLFWDKLNKYVQNSADLEVTWEPEFCPHCGQEIE